MVTSVGSLALAVMQTGANLETELSQAFSDRPPAVDGARGAVEGGVAAWRRSDAWRGGARPAPPAHLPYRLGIPTRVAARREADADQREAE